MNPTVVVLVVATVACLAVLNQPAAAIEAAIPQRSLDPLEPGVTPPWSARKPGMEPAIVTTEQRKPAVLHEAATAEEDSGKEKGKQEKKKCTKGNKLGIMNAMKTGLGGKGVSRRKNCVHPAWAVDVEKLQLLLKKLSVNAIPGIEEHRHRAQ
ncbi:hypothetical protein pipiens_004670 [Culex pipiens pipiens]|uniref:Uncharacterized protein n=1 Tax=Culex pipiens pipiens TaxID=38569 RepID=A0ABD1CHE0_CULPP